MEKLRGLPRTYQALLGIGMLAVLVAVGSVLKADEPGTLAKIPQWSERLGAGEVFPACGSSFVFSCTSAANACGLTNLGVLQLDGGCSVGAPPDSSCPTPSVSMIVPAPGHATIDAGQSTTLAWDSPGAAFCRWTGGFADATVDPSGSISTGPLSDTSTYQICCAYTSGVCSPATQLTVTVLHPEVRISAEPLRVRANGTSVVTWYTRDVKNCVIKRNGAEYLSASGAPDTITTQTTYTISCETNGDPMIRSVRVNVVPSYEEF